ncbi:MAG: amino acid permease [Bacteroidales bacterium]|nr:amino acid permease [Bacteroidales bacterium]
MSQNKSGFGTAPVFFTAIATILGAILFLRFGWAVGNLGFWGVMLIILVGHMVTIPTALSLSEIATNQKVEGGGEYFIISRSFGLNIGGTIGLALFFSQAISVAFYVIAFTEAFAPFFTYMKDVQGIDLPRQVISLPMMGLLALLILKKGADLGVKALYFVVAILFVSLAMFFIGSTDFQGTQSFDILKFDFTNMDQFFIVFAIIFPAFTGMTAGVGLSGDLKNPSKSIPLGSIAATLIGMVIYFFIAWKFKVSALSWDLQSDQLIMAKIALGGAFIIPLGLAASTISSALGSIMVAPRTLQALAQDRTLPFNLFSNFLAKSKGEKKEPFNASVFTIGIAFIFVAIGDVNAVGKIISMFFMITYGSLNLISFLYHWGADPSYRPSFKTFRWLSFLGFVMSFWLMFKMDFLYTIISLIAMTILYFLIQTSHKDRKGVEGIFQGALYQLSMRLKLFVQRSKKAKSANKWRPAVVCVSSESFQREKAFDLLNWFSYKYGYGTYIHLIEGFFNDETRRDAEHTLQSLLRRADQKKHNVYLDTLISPSYTSAIAQIVQLPGISGMENNMVLFEFFKEKHKGLSRIIDNYALVRAAMMDVCILSSANEEMKYRNGIHLWFQPQDFNNMNLMMMLSFIILGHPKWKKAQIQVYYVSNAGDQEYIQQNLIHKVQESRIPISEKNIETFTLEEGESFKGLVNKKSSEAGMVVVGFTDQQLQEEKEALFSGYDALQDVLFVSSYGEVQIK